MHSNERALRVKRLAPAPDVHVSNLPLPLPARRRGRYKSSDSVRDPLRTWWPENNTNCEQNKSSNKDTKQSQSRGRKMTVVSDSVSFGHSLLRLCRITSLRCSTDRAALIRNSFPPPICNSIWDNAFNEDLLTTSIFKKKIKSINHLKNFKTKVNSIPFGSA